MSVNRYLSISCCLRSDQEDVLAELLCRFPVLGCSLDQGDDGTNATIFLETGLTEEARRLKEELEGLGAAQIACEIVEDQDWFAMYREQVQPFEVGSKWWIDPDPDGRRPTPSNRIRLAIEPSVAFGSGTHESTRLVLEELERLPVVGGSVLDVGTGSGILALAAESLGARFVVGFDIDPQAVWTARRTLSSQEWTARTVLLIASVQALGDAQFDVVLCNMITTEFMEILPDLGRLLSREGRLIVSGSLESDRDLVVSAVEGAGFRVWGVRRMGEWMSLRAIYG